MDGKGVLVIGHFFWHIQGTREASKIPLPIKVFSNEVLTNCPRGQGEPYIAYGIAPPLLLRNVSALPEFSHVVSDRSARGARLFLDLSPCRKCAGFNVKIINELFDARSGRPPCGFLPLVGFTQFFEFCLCILSYLSVAYGQ